jgi:DNA oxidative demethylase
VEYLGFKILKGELDSLTQTRVVDDIREVVGCAPLFSPVTRWGKTMSVRMTSAGRYGWFSDKSGYRYISRHPSGVEWPPIPVSVLDIWTRLVGSARAPDCCLVNFYEQKARMGLHRDADEKDFSWPVLSISLGDPARFRMGGPERAHPTQSIRLESGDVVLLEGPARLAYHGIDRIEFGQSSVLRNGGRINLTLRVVD